MDPNEVKKKTAVYRDKEGNVVTSKDQAWSVDWTYVYADGRKQIWRSGPNEDPEQNGVLQSESTDTDQQKIWEDQKKQAATQTSAAGQESISAPANQQYVIRTGPKNAEHPDGIYYYPNPNYDPSKASSQAPGKKQTIEGDPPEVVIREIQPNGEPGRILEQRRATKKEIDDAAGGGDTTKFSPPYKNKDGAWVQSQTDANGQIIGTRPAEESAIPADKDQKTYVQVAQDPTTGKWHGLKSDGTWEEMQGGPGIKPTPAPIIDPSKPQAELVDDPNNPGHRIAAPIAGTAPPGGNAPPDIGALKAELGNITPELEDRHTKYQELVAASNGKYTQDDVAKWVDRDLKMAQARANEITAQLNAQANIRAQDISQRGQTLTDAGNRQRFAETASTNALNLVTKFPSIAARAGSGEGLTNVLQYLMNMQGEYGKTIGALPDTTPIGRAPGQEQAMGMGINGPGSNGPAPSVGPGGGGSPIVFNINTNGTSPAPITPDLGTMGSTMAAGVQQPDAASQATPVGSPGSPSQLIDQWADPKDPRWNSTLEQIKAELPAPPGVTSQGLRESGMRVAGGQLRAPGAGAVGGGPVSNGAVGAVG